MLARYEIIALVGEKSLILAEIYLIYRSNNIFARSSANRNEKTANQVISNLLGFATDVERILSSWVKTKLSDIGRFFWGRIILWTGCAEVVRSHRNLTSTNSLTVPLLSLSLAPQQCKSILPWIYIEACSSLSATCSWRRGIAVSM